MKKLIPSSPTAGGWIIIVQLTQLQRRETMKHVKLDETRMKNIVALIVIKYRELRQIYVSGYEKRLSYL